MAHEQVSLVGRVAVITGSTRGIGRAIAERYGRVGARVVISSTRPDAVSQTVAELESAGIACIGVPCDVSDLEQVQALCRRAIDAFGQVDIWVNNAGISGTFARTGDISPDVWRRVIDVNLVGCYHGCISVLPHMLSRRSGKIINVTGGGFKRSQRFLSAYSASKAGVVRLTEGLARDYVDHPGISFNVLAPGIVPTDMTNHWDAVGPAVDVLKDFPRIMRIFGTSVDETAEMALRMLASSNEKANGKTFEVLPRRRVLWRLATAALRR